MQLRKRLDNSKYQHNSVSQILSAWQIIQQKSNTGGGPDRGGDLGGVLHHPRVRGPGRVRTHPQDDPGPQAAGDQEPEGEEGEGQQGEGGNQRKL